MAEGPAIEVSAAERRGSCCPIWRLLTFMSMPGKSEARSGPDVDDEGDMEAIG